MNERVKSWLRRNGPLIVIASFAVLALLYLGDNIVNQRAERLSLTEKAPSVSSSDPYQGTKGSSVTVIEFAEFSCEVCAAEVSILEDIINDYGSEILLVWKDAPLDSLQTESRLASIAAQCANKQDKFWEMQEVLFAKQDQLGRELYLSTAKDIGLDVDEFTDCFDNRETNSIVDRNIDEANAGLVSATPTFFINDVKYEGYMEYADFIEAFNK